METLPELRTYFHGAELRFVRFFLLRICEWGANVGGAEASHFLSIFQEAYLNIQSSLVKGLEYLKLGNSDKTLWDLWRSAIIRAFDFYDYRGLWQQMEMLLFEGIKLAQSQHDPANEAVFLFFQARLDSQRGDSEMSLVKSERSLRLFTVQQDVTGRATLLHLRGMLLRPNDSKAARQSLEEALAIWEKIEAKNSRAATIYEIGRIEEMQGNKQVAEQLYREALAIFEELNLPREQATLLFQLGELLSEPQLLESALELFACILDERGYAQTLHQLGNAWYRRGDIDHAQELYQEAIHRFEKLGAPHSVRAVKRDRAQLTNGEMPYSPQ